MKLTKFHNNPKIEINCVNLHEILHNRRKHITVLYLSNNQ